MAQQPFAKIKKSSQYFDQNNTAKQNPEVYGRFPFPVEVVVGDPKGPLVRGGPGGQYHLAYVSLLLGHGTRELRIS